MKNLMMTLGLLVGTQAKAMSPAIDTTPECTNTIYNSKVGTRCKTGFDTGRILDVVLAHHDEIAELTAGGRVLGDIRVEIRKPKKKNYSPTLRYTFTSRQYNGPFSPPTRCLDSARWVVDSYMDFGIQDDTPTEYDSHGVHVKRCSN